MPAGGQGEHERGTHAPQALEGQGQHGAGADQPGGTAAEAVSAGKGHLMSIKIRALIYGIVLTLVLLGIALARPELLQPIPRAPIQQTDQSR